MFTRLFFALLAGFLLGAFCATRVVRDREVIIEEIGRTSIIRATVSEMPE